LIVFHPQQIATKVRRAKTPTNAASPYYVLIELSSAF
jgi:hypothetical protein